MFHFIYDTSFICVERLLIIKTYIVSEMCLNVELSIINDSHMDNAERKIQHFGRIIFHTEDVDKLYSYFKSNISISTVISFENEPTDAALSLIHI